MRSALTPEQKDEVRMLSASGRYSYRDLAKKYYVSVSTISNIIQGKRLETRKFSGYYRKPDRYNEKIRKSFDRKEITKKLIEVVSEYSLMDNWTELYLMETLLSCGLVKEDFEEAGCLDFYEEYFQEV